MVVTLSYADVLNRVEQAGVLASGEKVTAGELRRLACDATIVPIVLGSATPSLESLHNAHNGRYALRWMPERLAQAFRALLDAPADNLAEKADFLAGYAKEGKTGTYGAQWTAYARRGAR